jgi:hypothetical protein
VNLTESLAQLNKKLTQLSTVITEDKGHLDHPEDLVFLGSTQGATRALNAIIATAQQPETVTIKWDGYPALVFGRNAAGRFSIMDKHMFNKKDGTGRQVYSPEQFIQYDIDRGTNRSGLHQIINDIWSGLEKASESASGYYWGDLLFSKPLTEKNKLYTFKANPNGITYTVVANSELGKLITDKAAGIAVHQHLSPDAATTDQATTLNGTIGELQNNSDVAIVPSAMPNTPVIKLNETLVQGVKQAIAKYGDAVDELMTTAPQARNTFNGLFTTFINKSIVAGDLNNLKPRFLEYAAARPMTEPMRKKLFGYDSETGHVPGHFNTNDNGITGAFAIWAALYKLKMSIVLQLDRAAKTSPIKGYLADGTQTQEGFVAHGLKFVNRMGFSRQNLAGRA